MNNSSILHGIEVFHVHSKEWLELPTAETKDSFLLEEAYKSICLKNPGKKYRTYIKNIYKQIL